MNPAEVWRLKLARTHTYCEYGLKHQEQNPEIVCPWGTWRRQVETEIYQYNSQGEWMLISAYLGNAEDSDQSVE